MKFFHYKIILSAIGIIGIISCSQIFNKTKESVGIETGFLAARFQNLNVVRLTVSGKAQLTGTIKNAKVQARTIPKDGSEAGRCNGNAGSLLASGMTSSGSSEKNDGGYYSLTMEKPAESTLCLVITPTPASTAYSPFQKKPIPWKPKADSTDPNAIRISSIVLLTDVNSTTSRELTTSGNVNPLTNMATAKFAYAIKKQLQARLLSKKTTKSTVNYAIFSDTDMAAMVNNANEEIGAMFFKGGKKIDPSKINFGDPSAPGYDPSLAKQFNAVLGGIDSIINKLINGKGLNASEFDTISTTFDSFMELMSGDIAGDGALDGQGFVDSSGNPLTIPTDFATTMTDPAGSLAEGMSNYVTEIAATSGDDGSGVVWTASDVSNPDLTGGGITSSLPAPSALSYSGSPFVYTSGVAITSILPVVTGTVSSYSISPVLPTGLILNTITGEISGTPTVTQGIKTYTITASNSGGSKTTTISITINVTAPSSLTYGGTNYTYITGTTITSLTPSITGSVSSYSISPALPVGILFDATTGVISGTPTATQVATPHIVTATNAIGSTNTTITITVNALTISYTGTPFTFPIGATITTKNVTTNGTVVSYSISPVLPTGFVFDTVAGSISGTPSVTSGATAYTVTATASAGVTATANINATISNTAPTASVVNIAGTASTGSILTGSYTFNDADGHTEGVTTVAWYRCTSPSDAGTAIPGAIATTYTIQAADQSYYIKYGVTPKDQYGFAGIEVKSNATSMIPCAGSCTIYTNVALSTFTSSGWSICYQETYDISTTSIATIQTNCTGANLTVACRLTGDPTLITAASSPKTDVFFETGSGATSVHRANGVDWYFTSSYSWGYVFAGDTVNRSSCDTASSTYDAYRLCWHTSAGNLSGGYRCGVNTGAGATYERIILHK